MAFNLLLFESGQAAKCTRIAPPGHGMANTSGQKQVEVGQKQVEVGQKQDEMGQKIGEIGQEMGAGGGHSVWELFWSTLQPVLVEGIIKQMKKITNS